MFAKHQISRPAGAFTSLYNPFTHHGDIPVLATAPHGDGTAIARRQGGQVGSGALREVGPGPSGPSCLGGGPWKAGRPWKNWMELGNTRELGGWKSMEIGSTGCHGEMCEQHCSHARWPKFLPCRWERGLCCEESPLYQWLGHLRSRQHVVVVGLIRL